MKSFNTTRRDFLNQAGGLGTMATLGLVAQAGVLSSAHAAPRKQLPGMGKSASAGSLPKRGEYLIRGGYVLTYDPATGKAENLGPRCC